MLLCLSQYILFHFAHVLELWLARITCSVRFAGCGFATLQQRAIDFLQSQVQMRLDEAS